MASLSGSFLASRCAMAAAAPRRQLVIQNAHKKGAGSTKNGRDSNAQRRGTKVFGGQPVKAGGIIVRQVGQSWAAGDNCGLGSDYTLYSTIEGVVIFNKAKSLVSVYPHDHAKAQAELAKSHTCKPKEGVPTRAERRKLKYSPRGTAKAAEQTITVAQVAVPSKP